MNSTITVKDLQILSIFTDCLFCENFEDVVEFASEVAEEPINAFNLHNRQIQSKLKSLLWEDFLKVKAKLKRLSK